MDTNTSDLLVNTTTEKNYYKLCDMSLYNDHVYKIMVTGINELELGDNSSIFWKHNEYVSLKPSSTDSSYKTSVTLKLSSKVTLDFNTIMTKSTMYSINSDFTNNDKFMITVSGNNAPVFPNN